MSLDPPSLVEQGHIWLTDEEHNADGTFLFPPTPRNAEQHLQFWMHVEIPEPILDQATDVHRMLRKRDRNNLEQGAWNDEWKYRTFEQRKILKERGIETKEEFFQARADFEDQTFPFELKKRDARWVLRAYIGGNDAHLLPPEERQKVLDFKVPVRNKCVTIAEVDRLYPFSEMGMWDSVQRNPTFDVREAIERFHSTLRDAAVY